MKALTTDESVWVHVKLATYPIPYTEVYNEIADHVISAIEDARAHGDGRDIVLVFNEVMAFHFPSEKAIAKIVLKHVSAFNCKISHMMWKNYTYYLCWPVILLIAIAMAGSFYIPVNKLTSGTFIILLLILAAIPQWYALFKLPQIRRIKVDLSKSTFEPGNLIKRSLTQDFVKSRSTTLVLILIINNAVIGPLVRKYNVNFLNPMHYHPAFNMTLAIVFAIYGLSCIRLCKQELKLNFSNTLGILSRNNIS